MPFISIALWLIPSYHHWSSNVWMESDWKRPPSTYSKIWTHPICTFDISLSISKNKSIWIYLPFSASSSILTASTSSLARSTCTFGHMLSPNNTPNDTLTQRRLMVSNLRIFELNSTSCRQTALCRLCAFCFCLHWNLDTFRELSLCVVYAEMLSSCTSNNKQKKKEEKQPNKHCTWHMHAMHMCSHRHAMPDTT